MMLAKVLGQVTGFLLGVLVFFILFMIAVDAYQFEKFGDCEGCMFLGEWFDARNND